MLTFLAMLTSIFLKYYLFWSPRFPLLLSRNYPVTLTLQFLKMKLLLKLWKNKIEKS